MVFPDGNRKIDIEEDIIKRACQHLQIGFRTCESGGTLIGRENISTDNLIIDHMTEPFSKDKQSRIRYSRRDPKHISYFEDLFKKSNGKYRYVGEWHTHPEKVPSYSTLDRKEWFKIIDEKPEIAPIYCVIFGTEKWRVWKVQPGKINPILIFEDRVM